MARLRTRWRRVAEAPFRTQRRGRRLSRFVLAVIAVAEGCSSPTAADRLSSISIVGPTSLIVAERALATVVATDASGQVIPLTQPAVWRSTDTRTMTVSSDGTVRGNARGTATLSVQVGERVATIEITIRAKVGIEPVGWVRWSDGTALEPTWRLAIGDSLRVVTTYTDIDGRPLVDVPVPTWTSTAPEIVRVTDEGVVTGLSQGGADVIALTPDGSASLTVSVPDVVAGRPALVRFTHAIAGLGPVRFVPNKGDPVTLSFGESLERPVTSGTLLVDVEGLPTAPSWEPFRHYAALVRESDHLSLYAVGSDSVTYLSAAWTRGTTVAEDSVRVRLVQGDGAWGVVYVLRADEGLEAGPTECYFDPLDVSAYYSRSAGDLDIVLQTKYGVAAQRRVRVSVPAGRSATIVVAGSGTPVLLVVEDP